MHANSRGATALSLMLYTALTLSTALQFTFGPEAVLRFSGFYTQRPDSRDAAFRSRYPDFGSLAGDVVARTALEHGELWKFSGVWADSAYYVEQVTSPQHSIPPYRYRLFATTLVRLAMAATGMTVEGAFVLLNVVMAVATAMLFEAYLGRHFQLQRALAILGGCLFVTSAANTGTVALPMLEPAASLFSCLIFSTVASGNALGFLVAAILGVATKEVLVVSGLLWWLAAPSVPGARWQQRLLVSLVPFAAFVAIRMAMGGAPLEVNYGFNLLKGDFPSYGKRLLSIKSLAGVLFQIFLAFSFLWVGLLNVPKHPLLRRSAILVPLVIVLAILLSSRLTRVLGILFPIVLPGFLMFFREASSEHPSRIR